MSRLVARARQSERVLDVGGWYRPFNLATHVVDVLPYATRRQHDAIDPEHEPRFTAETWSEFDICGGPWPYEDNAFDFAICSHTLEDIRDPLFVCRELERVARAGYVEFPSRQREIFSKARFFALKRALGRMPEVGFSHHRWFVEVVEGRLEFSAKTTFSLSDPAFYITRRELGRKMRLEESGAFLFWQDRLPAEERNLLDDEARAKDLADFKKQALAGLRGR